MRGRGGEGRQRWGTVVRLLEVRGGDSAAGREEEGVADLRAKGARSWWKGEWG
jgi:hypothetical protein